MKTLAYAAVAAGATAALVSLYPLFLAIGLAWVFAQAVGG